MSILWIIALRNVAMEKFVSVFIPKILSLKNMSVSNITYYNSITTAGFRRYL